MISQLMDKQEQLCEFFAGDLCCDATFKQFFDKLEAFRYIIQKQPRTSTRFRQMQSINKCFFSDAGMTAAVISTVIGITFGSFGPTLGIIHVRTSFLSSFSV